MDRDPELDELLAPLQADAPEASTVRRWGAALSAARTPQRPGGPRRWAIAAGLVLMFGAGFGAGALVFRREAPARASFASSRATSANSGSAATEEHLFAKPD